MQQLIEGDVGTKPVMSVGFKAGGFFDGMQLSFVAAERKT